MSSYVSMAKAPCASEKKKKKTRLLLDVFSLHDKIAFISWEYFSTFKYFVLHNTTNAFMWIYPKARIQHGTQLQDALWYLVE